MNWVKFSTGTFLCQQISCVNHCVLTSCEYPALNTIPDLSITTQPAQGHPITRSSYVNKLSVTCLRITFRPNYFLFFFNFFIKKFPQFSTSIGASWRLKRLWRWIKSAALWVVVKESGKRQKKASTYLSLRLHALSCLLAVATESWLSLWAVTHEAIGVPNVVLYLRF